MIPAARAAIWVIALLLIAYANKIYWGDSQIANADSEYTESTTDKVRAANCAQYSDWSNEKHSPLSEGQLKLPYQRPPIECRTFRSKAVDLAVQEISKSIVNLDCRRVFENAFPNTLDTTIRYFQESPPLTFVVTGDIDAEWLRDSHRQLGPYQKFAAKDKRLAKLINGAIQLQSRYVLSNPFCNAFHPPLESGLNFKYNNLDDRVYPRVDATVVFECKQELDSLASFLGLSREYYQATGDVSFMTADWRSAVDRMFRALKDLSRGTYDKDTGHLNSPPYSFQRWTDSGTETQPNGGAGNPVRDIGLFRSFFRPSDDATIYQYLIPANAQLSVELKALAGYIDDTDISEKAHSLAQQIKEAIYEHAVVEHPVFGKVFAYEIDGYGSHSLMDDANIPSLLSLPELGFVPRDDSIYQNTRNMILSADYNPYYIKGRVFEGVGGPHIGTRNAWPMSLLVAIRTTDEIDEIKRLLKLVVNSTDGLGLIHESINVEDGRFTRSWFAWANSEFANTILDLKQRGLLEQATRF